MELAENTSPKKRYMPKLKGKNLFNINMTIMILPGLLFFLVFSYLPMVGIIVAFKNYNFKDGIFMSQWIGFNNFKFFFHSDYALRITFNTLFLNSLFILFNLFSQVGIAIILNEMKNRLFVKVSNTIMFLPYFVSWVIVGFFAYSLLNMDYGLINKLLQYVGLQPVEWYNRPELWPGILTICTIWKSIGYGSIIYTAVIAGINSEYFDAAVVDGANRWQQVMKITIPLLKPTIIVLTILAIGKIFYCDFGMFYNLTLNSGMLLKTTDVMDTFVVRTVRATGDFGLSSAAGLIQSIVGFVLVIITNTIVKKIDKEYALY